MGIGKRPSTNQVNAPRLSALELAELPGCLEAELRETFPGPRGFVLELDRGEVRVTRGRRWGVAVRWKSERGALDLRVTASAPCDDRCALKAGACAAAASAAAWAAGGPLWAGGTLVVGAALAAAAVSLRRSRRAEELSHDVSLAAGAADRALARAAALARRRRP